MARGQLLLLASVLLVVLVASQTEGQQIRLAPNAVRPVSSFSFIHSTSSFPEDFSLHVTLEFFFSSFPAVYLHLLPVAMIATPNSPTTLLWSPKRTSNAQAATLTWLQLSGESWNSFPFRKKKKTQGYSVS